MTDNPAFDALEQLVELAGSGPLTFAYQSRETPPWRLLLSHVGVRSRGLLTSAVAHGDTPEEAAGQLHSSLTSLTDGNVVLNPFNSHASRGVSWTGSLWTAETDE